MTATNLRDHARAIRYRQLALREADKSKAALLNLIADEAERGVLVTSDSMGEFFQTSQLGCNIQPSS